MLLYEHTSGGAYYYVEPYINILLDRHIYYYCSQMFVIYIL